MYNPKSTVATEFICHDEIADTLQYARENCSNRELVEAVLQKAFASRSCASA